VSQEGTKAGATGDRKDKRAGQRSIGRAKRKAKQSQNYRKKITKYWLSVVDRGYDATCPIQDRDDEVLYTEATFF